MSLSFDLRLIHSFSHPLVLLLSKHLEFLIEFDGLSLLFNTLLAFSFNMHCRWSKLLALLPTLLALAASESLEASTKFPSPLTLRPIKLSDYESASVLSRRESEKFSDLDMKTQDELIFGSPGGETHNLDM